MKHFGLASPLSGSSREVDTARHSGVLARADVENLCAQLSPRLVIIASSVLMQITKQAAEDRLAGVSEQEAIQKSAQLGPVMTKMFSDYLFEKLEPLLVGRSEAHARDLQTEAKP